MEIDKILKDLNPIENSIREAIISAYNLGKADGEPSQMCDGCGYKERNLEEYPCCKCRRIAFDYFKARGV